MSNDFRIYNRPLVGRAPERQEGRKDQRLLRFKRGRRPGDIVRGIFLRLEGAAPGTAWVNLEGEELLAELPPDLAELSRLILAGRGVGATPTGVTEADFPLRAGSDCYFVLEKLDPEPVLRMLELGTEHVSAAHGEPAEYIKSREQALIFWRNIADLPPAQLAARYAMTRTALDHTLHERLWPLLRKAASLKLAGPADQTKAPSPRAVYLSFLSSNPEAMDRHAELNLLRAAIVGLLRPFGLRDLLFLPWLCPEASAIGLALLQKQPDFLLQAKLPDGRLLNVRGNSGNLAGLRQTVEAPGSADLLAGLLALHPGAGGGFSRRG
ncbi:MAG: hypothetical protein LBV80_08840 [Deltaproteobacteria bacterium]|jgi:hypothetical protein|nr:hypothetical protein [Deltaproteobacteria bacterium]